MKIGRIFTKLCSIVALSLCCAVVTSCDDQKSYAELLDEETDAVEKFLKTQKVVEKIPADSVFEVGEDAPYYKLDEDGYVYMQVLMNGEDGKAHYNELIFFRYSRINLLTWAEGGTQVPSGNDNDLSKAYSFNFQNTNLDSSSQYGTGIQMPLNFLEMPCKVNLLVKSKAGSLNDLTSVTPYLYTVRYYRSNI
ncbi:MAG: DUF4827 family protein [Muribaculaceae bacterium]|nr:DUF4827 family protein [Muribaculaceae bacterium]